MSQSDNAGSNSEEYEEIYQEFSDEDDLYVVEDDDLLYEATGDFTKRYNRMREQQQLIQQVHASVVKPVPSLTASTSQINTNTASEVNNAASKWQDTVTEALERKYAHRIQMVSPNSQQSMSNSVRTDIKLGSKKAEGDKVKLTDKSDRATTEQVLDPRTRIILFKLLNKNEIYEINGCVSTGKEANVYHARTESGEHRAIKIYKTSILVFKDRDRYVTGEYRFRHGYAKHNPRKMVKVWAEKEMRNLKRLHSAGIPCPEPLLLRMHVLLMTFVGDKDGWAAPRLKDAVFGEDKARELYHQLVKIMRTMFQVCRLVHADLSEYNLLYHKGKVYVIDVSQSVEHDHPNALEFLRKDCANVHDFFKKRNIDVMSIRDLFDFVTKPELSLSSKDIDISTMTADQVMDSYLDEYQQSRLINRETEESRQMEDAVFSKAFIPRCLDEVINVERDIQKMKEGGTNALVYQGVVESSPSKRVEPTVQHDLLSKVMGLGLNMPEPVADELTESSSESDTDSSFDSDDSDADSDEEKRSRKPESIMKLDKDDRKAHKKAVKEQKREKRKTKMSKATKKRKEKVSTRRK